MSGVVQMDDKKVIRLSEMGKMAATRINENINEVRSIIKSMEGSFDGQRAEDVKKGFKDINDAMNEVEEFCKKAYKTSEEFAAGILAMSSNPITSEELANIKSQITQQLDQKK